MGKVLHLIPDEKVTDNVIENFEKVFSDNIFFVLGDKNKRKYCKSVGSNIIFGNKEFFVRENIPTEVKGIVIHGLNHIFAKMILNISTKITIGWFAWGYDIYFLPKIMGTLYATETYCFLTKRSKKFALVNKIKKNNFLRGLYYKIILQGEDYYANYEKAYNRIDYFCSYIREDYDLFTSYYTTTASFLQTGYFSIDQYLAGQEMLRVCDLAQNILIGNSNSAECNHLDVFSTLNEYCEWNAKLIVPLNYGEDEVYKSEVIKQGRLNFGSQFMPLLDFMDRGEYFELLTGCSTAVFYHYRQQAMGNIIAFLYMGGRVYLSSKNPVYNYMVRLGIRVFDFDKEFQIFKNSKLTEEEVTYNQSILNRYFNKDVILRESNNLICKLLDVNR